MYEEDKLAWDEGVKGALLCFYALAWLHSPFSAVYHAVEAVGMGESIFRLWKRLDFLAIFASSISLAAGLAWLPSQESPALWWLSIGGVAGASAYVAFTLNRIRPDAERLELTAILIVSYTLPLLHTLLSSLLSLQLHLQLA